MPKEFTQERPAIHFTAQSFETPIEIHPLGCQFPEATDDPSIQSGPDAFESFSVSPDGPRSLRDYLSRDQPVLSLHVTSFTNATVVALVWPHAISGAAGLKQILLAWSTALQDEGKIPFLLGTREDVLDDCGTEADEQAPYHLEKSEIKGLAYVKLMSRLAWDLYRNPKVESRIICLPPKFISQLRLQISRDLEAVHGNSAPFVSDGDILTAWAARFVAQRRGGPRPLLVLNALDISSRLETLRGSEGVYVQNFHGVMYTSLNADLMKRPLGELAHATRLSIQELATDEQIRAQLGIFRAFGHKQMAPIYGDPDAHVVAFTNWTKFNMFNAVDFSPAVVTSSPRLDGRNNLGKPKYMHCMMLGDDKRRRNVFTITGKDLDNNYWISAWLYPEDWEELERYVQSVN